MWRLRFFLVISTQRLLTTFTPHGLSKVWKSLWSTSLIAKLHSHHPSCSNSTPISTFVTPLTLPRGLPVWSASSHSFAQQIWFLLHLIPSPHATHFSEAALHSTVPAPLLLLQEQKLAKPVIFPLLFLSCTFLDSHFYHICTPLLTMVRSCTWHSSSLLLSFHLAPACSCITSKSLNDGIKHLAALISLDPWDY